MKKKPRILFLSHSASRNGAHILLMHLLRGLKSTVDWEMAVLIDGSGPLLEETRSIVPTTVWRNPASLLKMALGRKMASLRSRLEIQSLQALLVGQRYDLIYANTIATWPLVRALANRAPALLWHIHELGYAFRLSTGEERISELFHRASRFIAVSNSVRKTLSRELNIRDDTVDLVHEFVSGVPVGVAEQRVLREEVRRRLGLPSDVFVVGGCGGLGWRKGTDLFLQVARIVCKAKGDHKVKFLWIGGEAEDKAALEFAYDLRAMGLEESCIRVPATRDVLQYYSAMDVLAVTSREDPFPLVMLEAGSYGVPIVCFADSGGAPEYAGGDAGLVAPYLDVAAFAANLVRLQEMPDLRERLGAAALTKVRTHYTAENQVPKIQKIIERCLVGRASS